jgi:FtsP/CotA-like multicopper oxidase with cupredoxin domain
MLRVPFVSRLRLAAVGGLVLSAAVLDGCLRRSGGGEPAPGAGLRAKLRTPLVELHDDACEPGQSYKQEDLREPTKIEPVDGVLQTEMVVAFRKRCVPVWIKGTPGHWEMQTLSLRTYGFPADPKVPITEADANEPDSPKIAWSAPGPTFVLHPASKPGASDGTQFKMRLYNRMPYEIDPYSCVANLKCNTSGPDAGVDPSTGKCRAPIDPNLGGQQPEVPHQSVNGQVIEPPNCFHGLNSTNFHFHGFHVSPQAPQDNVGLELRPPKPQGISESFGTHATHGLHGGMSMVAFGHYDFVLDPLRYTQAPGTHWYHAHKHGSTALHVLNGQVGTFEIRGEFDNQLEAYFKNKGGGELRDRLMVVQQLQEKQPGLGGVDQTGSVLVNGQANPIVRMKRGEIQRWRFVGATMQAAASLRIGFPGGQAGPEVRQIAMDGVQFSPDNYKCQPFLNNPNCSKVPDTTPFDELTAFSLAPGNRVDVLVRAPDTAGKHCMVLDIPTKLAKANKSREQHAARATLAQDTCGQSGGLGPLFTLVVEDEVKSMQFPGDGDFPALPAFLADLPPVTDPARQKAIHYQMVNLGNLAGTQFWINQEKFNGSCANETLTIDVPEQWTLWNNSLNVAHPFHIHQNPFQLISQSDRGTYSFPVWRDVMPIPTAPTPAGGASVTEWLPNSNPQDPKQPWGSAVIVYVAKEFTGGFVNHCHILGHEDRGMMHNTQAVCPDGQWAQTGPVPPGTTCDDAGFCPNDCQQGGAAIKPTPPCAAPPPQRSGWPSLYGVDAGVGK